MTMRLQFRNEIALMHVICELYDVHQLENLLFIGTRPRGNKGERSWETPQLVN